MAAPTRYEIAEVFKKHDCDKGFLHGYDIMYGTLFEKLGVPSSLLEVGFRRGKSAASWAELFPEATLKFVEISMRNDVIDAAKNLDVLIANSTRPTLAEKLGNKTYDVIIDDGDHRPDSQWQTFINLADSWTKAYVIEDIISTENMELLRRRLISKGYKDIHSFTSKLKDGIVRIRGVDTPQTFYSIVVYPK